MQNQVNNINLQAGSQSEAMAASSAMIVSGLEKELKTNKSNLIIDDPKVNLKQLEEYIQKLTNTTSVEKIKKREEEKQRGEQEREKQESAGRQVSFSGRAKPFEWKTNDRVSGNFFLDLFASFQKQVLKSLLDYAFMPGIEELVRSAKELSLALDGLKFEKISLKEKGRVLLTSELTESDRQYLFLTDELKILELGLLLEEEWVKLFIIRARRNFVLRTLRSIRADEETIEKIRLSAKELAWLKIIHELKAAHLKRVFCGSKKDFDFYSSIIEYYTQKLRKIDLNRPVSELEMIKIRLHELALETAQYKLEILRSMQKLAFDKNREKDIVWLESTLKHLKNV